MKRNDVEEIEEEERDTDMEPPRYSKVKSKEVEDKTRTFDPDEDIPYVHASNYVKKEEFVKPQKVELVGIETNRFGKMGVLIDSKTNPDHTGWLKLSPVDMNKAIKKFKNKEFPCSVVIQAVEWHPPEDDTRGLSSGYEIFVKW